MSALPASYRGIIAMSCAMVLFVVNDAICKSLVREWPVGQVSFVRALIMSVGIGALLLAWRQPNFLGTALHPGVLLRTLLDAGATILGFLALFYMTLADFAAINTISPLLLTLLAVVIFREPVGWRRPLAIVVGLVGALIVVKLDVFSFNSYAIFGFLCATCSASRDLVTSRLHTRAPTLTIIFLSAIAVMPVSLIMGFWESWQPPTASHTALIAAAAFFLASGNFMIVVAFRSAPIASVAPFRYTLLLWSPIAGYIVFGDVPDRWFYVGGSLIAAAGIYTLHRERVRHRYLASTASLPEAES